MNDKVKQWIEALRSGRYPQGQSCLRSCDNKFCCLGVACDLSVSGHWLASSSGIFTQRFEANNGHVEALMLPSEVREEFGIDSDFENELARMNDEGVSFRTIADKLEQAFS